MPKDSMTILKNLKNNSSKAVSLQINLNSTYKINIRMKKNNIFNTIFDKANDGIPRGMSRKMQHKQ